MFVYARLLCGISGFYFFSSKKDEKTKQKRKWHHSLSVSQLFFVCRICWHWNSHMWMLEETRSSKPHIFGCYHFISTFTIHVFVVDSRNTSNCSHFTRKDRQQHDDESIVFQHRWRLLFWCEYQTEKYDPFQRVIFRNFLFLPLLLECLKMFFLAATHNKQREITK